MSDLRKRIANVGVSLNNADISRDIEIQINVSLRIPFISMSQLDGTGGSIAESSDVSVLEYNNAFESRLTPSTAITKIKNILVDPVDATRFTTIAVISSLLTQNESVLVHDAKYKDLLLIPSLNFIGDDSSENLLAGTRLVIDAYQVGGSVDGMTESIYQEIQENLNITLPPNPLVTKTHLMTIRGFKGVGGFVNKNGSTFNTKYVESDVGPVLQLSSIGSSLALGGSTKTARLIKTSSISNALLPMKAGDLADVLILAQF